MKPSYFFSVRESEPRETRDSSLSARFEIQKREEDAAQQKLEVEAAQKDLYGLFFLFSGGCTVLEQHRKECESKT